MLVDGPIQEDWIEVAACLGAGPDPWFPGKGAQADRKAKRICAGCPVRSDCLEYALTHHERYGVWGGLNEKERRAVRRRVA